MGIINKKICGEMHKTHSCLDMFTISTLHLQPFRQGKTNFSQLQERNYNTQQKELLIQFLIEFHVLVEYNFS